MVRVGGDPAAINPQMAAEVWTPAFIAIGSNLDGPRAQVEVAIEALGSIPETKTVVSSPLYGSKALGLPGQAAQPDYVNAVAAVLTRLEPLALLRALLALEKALGRHRDGRKWGPRHIDLDLLLHGDNVAGGQELELPHPGLDTRGFVLLPLADLAPALRLPDGRLLARLLQGTDRTQAWKL